MSIKITTRNLFPTDFNEWAVGGLSVGKPTNVQYRRYTPKYYPINAINRFVLTKNNSDRLAIHFYSEKNENTFISEIRWITAANSLINTGNKLPENAEFFRIECSLFVDAQFDKYTDDAMLEFLNSTQLEPGDTATPYIPHIIEVDRIVQTTRNLFDKNKVIGGGYINVNGEIYESDRLAWKYTDFIKVNSCHVTLTGVTPSDAASICVYDANKNRIGSKRYDNNTITMSVPDTHYVRFSVLKVELGVTQLEEGTEPTPYVPHFLEADKIVQTTRNLFDKNSPNDHNFSMNWNSTTVVYPQQSNSNARTYVFKCKPNTDYSFSMTTKSDRLIIGEFYDDPNGGTVESPITGKILYWGGYEVDVPYSITVRTTNSGRWLAVYYKYNIAPTNLQIEEGTEATPYVPHFLEIKSVKQNAENSIKTISEEE